jgi:hypothetical protein
MYSPIGMSFETWHWAACSIKAKKMLGGLNGQKTSGLYVLYVSKIK